MNGSLLFIVLGILAASVLVFAGIGVLSQWIVLLASEYTYKKAQKKLQEDVKLKKLRAAVARAQAKKTRAPGKPEAGPIYPRPS